MSTRSALTTTHRAFVYAYAEQEDDTMREMRAYGVDASGRNVCFRVQNYPRHIYIELTPPVRDSVESSVASTPKSTTSSASRFAAKKASFVEPEEEVWTHSRAGAVAQAVKNTLYRNQQADILSMEMEIRKGLFYADKAPRAFLKIVCATSAVARNIGFKLRAGPVDVMGRKHQLKVHEGDASALLQLCCYNDIPTVGWWDVEGSTVSEDDQLTMCDVEVKVRTRNGGAAHNSKSSATGVRVLPKIARGKNEPPPDVLVMCFDIETNSSNPSAMPKATNPHDAVFQISCVFSGKGRSESVLMTLGKPDPKKVSPEATVYTYATESDLLVDFTNVVRERNPNVICGYNIFCFDIPYLLDRAKLHLVMANFDVMGFHRFRHGKERSIKWSSSAFRNQEFNFLDVEGRLFVDLLPIVRKDYKLDNYKLKTVSEFFLGPEMTKDPIGYKDIFRSYREGVKNPTKEGVEMLAQVGKYCIQDSVLVSKLYAKLSVFIGLAEAAAVSNVSMFAMYTAGQQIKVYSQVYKFCFDAGVVVEKDGYKTDANEQYVGAYVFDPEPGVYDQVVPFDFMAFYPNTITAYNLDYSTIVSDGNKSIPDTECHVMEWEDHVRCPHDPKVVRRTTLSSIIDAEKIELTKLRGKRNGTKRGPVRDAIEAEISRRVEALKPLQKERSELATALNSKKNVMCAKRKYRFLKEPMGVVPTVIQNMLDLRKKTRAMMKTMDKNSLEYSVLEKRQLAYKVQANSMYGSMGVKRGYLPFMPGAMCTTYMCRENIKVVAKAIPEKFGGRLVYGDTDSNYVMFPSLKNAPAWETWKYAETVAREISRMFPSSVNIDFEQVIYWKFLILTKKRYMYTSCDRSGVVADKIGKKGVLLARRDTAQFIRDVYEHVVKMVFESNTEKNVVDYLLEVVNELCSGQIRFEKFVITKAIGSVETRSDDVAEMENQKGKYKLAKKNEGKGMIGDYTVNLLKNDTEEATEQKRKKKARDADEFYLKSLPAQVQLAEKIRRRGHRVDVGSRLEYLILDTGAARGERQSDKIESMEYFAAHRGVLKVDYIYYLRLMSTSIDEILGVVFGERMSNFVFRQYQIRAARNDVLQEIKAHFKPKVEFVDV